MFLVTAAEKIRPLRANTGDERMTAERTTSLIQKRVGMADRFVDANGFLADETCKRHDAPQEMWDSNELAMISRASGCSLRLPITPPIADMTEA
jgi:hypothetical protein